MALTITVGSNRTGVYDVFTTVDYDKFRELRVIHLAARFEDLITDEANDELTPEQLFFTATADALELRGEHRVNAMIKKAGFPLPTASVAEIDYREGRGITKVRMQRYATHDWASETFNVIITSPSGAGKTYLACALGIAAC